MARKVYLKDRLVPAAEASVSVFDHGLLYGDGIFEGIRLYDGRVFALDEHLERFEFSAKAIMLDLPMDRAGMQHSILETCRANELEDGYVRLICTRGPGSLGLSPIGCEPVLIVIADTIQLYPEAFYNDGLEIITVPTRRSGPAALPPMIKSLNYLNNVLAKIEAAQAGYLEAIMLNDQGYVAECTGDNVFTIFKGKLYTPPTAEGALRGITRGVVLDLAEDLDIPIVEMEMTRYDLWIADECFLTGTAAEVVPVVRIDGRVIGNGRPGPFTRSIMDGYRRRTRERGTPF